MFLHVASTSQLVTVDTPGGHQQSSGSRGLLGLLDIARCTLNIALADVCQIKHHCVSKRLDTRTEFVTDHVFMLQMQRIATSSHSRVGVIDMNLVLAELVE